MFTVLFSYCLPCLGLDIVFFSAVSTLLRELLKAMFNCLVISGFHMLHSFILIFDHFLTLDIHDLSWCAQNWVCSVLFCIAYNLSLLFHIAYAYEAKLSRLHIELTGQTPQIFHVKNDWHQGNQRLIFKNCFQEYPNRGKAERI